MAEQGAVPLRDISVGTAVRISWQGAARRGIVACLGDSFEVAFQVIFDDDGSEATVDGASIRHLEPFEEQPASCSRGPRLQEEAARCKEEGNTLFRLGDAVAAVERYSAAIGALGHVDTDARPALILVALDGTIWATARSPEPDQQQVQLIQRVGGLRNGAGSRLPAGTRMPLAELGGPTLAVQPELQGDLQAALYLNRARCWLALGSSNRAVQDTGIAAALRRAAQLPPESRDPRLPARLAGVPRQWLQLSGLVAPVLCLLLALACASGGPATDGLRLRERALALATLGGVAYLGVLVRDPRNKATDPVCKDAQLCSAHFLRGRARVLQGRLKAAKANLAAAKAAAEEPAQLRELAKLQQEISEARRGNRRLAREISRWCDAALETAGADAFAAAAIAEGGADS